jgi:hypothetical protein
LSRFIVTLLTGVLLAGMLAPVAAGPGELALSAAERAQWEDRLQPFVIGFLKPFPPGGPTDDLLIDFGCRYTQRVIYKTFRHLTVTVDEVDAAARLFFGRTVENHHSLPDLALDGDVYRLTPALGEARREAHLEALYAQADGTFVAVFWRIIPGDNPWPAGQPATKELIAALRSRDIRFYNDGRYKAGFQPITENGVTRCILTSLEQIDE